MFRPTVLAGSISIALSLVSSAGLAAEDTNVMELDSVTILGTKTALPADEQSRAIDILTQKQIDLQQGNNLGALIGELPNVNLMGSPRPGGQQVQIRGLSGNRILTLVDGVGERFSKGHLGNSFIDPDLLKQVDVERGPATKKSACVRTGEVCWR